MSSVVVPSLFVAQHGLFVCYYFTHFQERRIHLFILDFLFFIFYEGLWMAFLTSHVRKQNFQFPRQLRQLVYHVYWLISVMVSRFNYCFFALYFSAYSISVAVKKTYCVLFCGYIVILKRVLIVVFLHFHWFDLPVWRYICHLFSCWLYNRKSTGVYN